MENRTRLKPSIGLHQAVALYIGAVLGSGVLIVPGLSAEIAGPASLIAWGLMTVLVLPMALTMGILAAKFPNAGGVSHFVTIAFGEKAGVLIGWFFLMSVPIGAPVAALTGAGYLSAAMGYGETARIIIAIVILSVGLLVNLFGMKLAGQFQVAVVVAILAVLIMGIAGSIPNIELENFTPFMPNGWISVGKAAAILFWCFIGWEAVSHLSEEFIDPQREAVKGVTIASLLVGVLYFLTAFATVGTHSYGSSSSDAPLVFIIKEVLGAGGAFAAGFTGAIICTAGIIAYVGAASRVAFALARNGNAPRALALLSKKRGTPVGGLIFLAVGFIVVLVLYGSGFVSLAVLIQIPNATFILTYLGGCAAGIRLLKENKWGYRISWLSFLFTAVIFPFVGWAVIYPVVICVIYWLTRKFPSTRFAPSQHT